MNLVWDHFVWAQTILDSHLRLIKYIFKDSLPQEAPKKTPKNLNEVCFGGIYSIWRSNDSTIKEIKIYNKEIKISLLADDITMILADLISVKNSLTVLNIFTKCSGLNINIYKTQAKYIVLNSHVTTSPIACLGLKHQYKHLV